MAVPLLSLTEQNSAHINSYRAAFERVMGSCQFIMGDEVKRFEKACSEVLDVKHAIGVSSGTDALLLALMAIDLKPGDEVICPSFTFFATGGSIARMGAKPVFADVCEKCFNLDVKDIERKITHRTRAIIPVHLYGQPADMDEIMKVAEEHNLLVIEDAAQAFGSRYKGKRVGSIGEFGCFSFFPSKNLGGFGDAGLLTTNDDDLAEYARILRVHGMEPKYFHRFIGANFRIDALQAALLAVKLPQHEESHRSRALNAEYYNQQFSLLGIGSIDDEPQGMGAPLLLPFEQEGRTHIWNQYTIRVRNESRSGETTTRDALYAYLISMGIGCEVYYPMPLHRQECFSYLPETTLPVSELLSTEVLSIPIYPELRQEQQDEVIAAVVGFFHKYKTGK